MNKIKNTLAKIKGMWNTPMKGRYLNIKETLRFCTYSLGVSFMINMVNYVAGVAYIPYFYGIETIHAYIIVALGSFTNMLLQPVIGNMIEKVRTKWGKYKPYIIFSMPLFALFAILVTWIPQFDDKSVRITYAYLTCVPVLLLSTFFNNMYQTMPSIITPNTQERADIMTPVGLVFGFAPSILQIIAGPVRAYYKNLGMEYYGLRILGIVSVAIGIVCVLFIIKVKERVFTIENKKEDKVTTREAFSMLFKNKPLVILCIALILGSLREFTVQFRWLVIQFRFASDVTTAIAISGIPMTVIGLASTVAMLLLPIVTRKMDKNRIMILFTSFGVVANAILGFVGYDSIPVGAVSVVVVTLLYFISMITPVYLLVPIMLGEIADYQQYSTGKRLEGHLQNLLFTIPILFSQVFMMGAWFWQKAIGFEAMDYESLDILTEAQQAVACRWFNAVSIISAVSGMLMIIVLFFYPLSKKKHNDIVEKLTAQSIISKI